MNKELDSVMKYLELDILTKSLGMTISIIPDLALRPWGKEEISICLNYNNYNKVFFSLEELETFLNRFDKSAKSLFYEVPEIELKIDKKSKLPGTD